VLRDGDGVCVRPSGRGFKPMAAGGVGAGDLVGSGRGAMMDGVHGVGVRPSGSG